MQSKGVKDKKKAMHPSKTLNLRLVCFLAALSFLAFACQKEFHSSLPVVPLSVDGHAILAEVANQPATRTTGLMFRRELGKDDGMLFVFTEPQPLNFWMHNTLIPLSIAYMDANGRILNILEMPAETDQTFPSAGAAKYTLEMNAGWYTKNGVKAGDTIQGVLQAPKAEN